VDDKAYSLIRYLTLLIAVFGAIGLVSACGGEAAPEPPATEQAAPIAQGIRVLPTLYPTATQFPSPAPVATSTPQPTSAPTTEVAFDQLVVDVTYTIPALDLNRRIRGNVAGEIEVSDESTGASVTLKNRPGVIVEMQQALPQATIDDLPADCDSCVQIGYELPLTNQSGQGWLRDTQLLASLENYTAVALGPHFPPGTIAGLRREATVYEVAHSAAITSQGEVWSWTATEQQVDQPVISDSIAGVTAGYMASIDWSSLPTSVGYICFEGGGSESLLLIGPEGAVAVQVRCPELYLPGQLVPIYSALSESVAGRLGVGEVSPPELPMTLDTVVLYRRVDGSTLSLLQRGTVNVKDAAGGSYTLTLTTTQTLSLTESLFGSPLLQEGPSAIFESDAGNVILVRGPDMVYELTWTNPADIPQDLIRPWDELLERAIQDSGPGSGQEPSPAPTATETGEG
jgi:hypothetical protein